MSQRDQEHDDHTNRDPISGTPGSHPLGTGIGAALGGAATGAVTGFVAGPVGTVIGAAVGAVIGGLAGKDFAEVIDPTREQAYWRENFSGRSYVEHGSSFDDFGPAYGFGVSAFGSYPGQIFADIEPELSRDWSSRRGASTLGWDRAGPAARDAWDRVDRSVGRS